MTQTVLMVSHAHPDFSKGGGEVAAHHLHEGLNQLPFWASHFLGRHALPGLVDPEQLFLRHRGEQETLFHAEADFFTFSSRGPQGLHRQFLALLERLQPGVVHLHHYWQVGLEMIGWVRHWNPRVPVVVTLHEFLAICAQNGQMLKTNGQLCTASGPAVCHACLPAHRPVDFQLRQRYLQAFFREVDHFIAPSQFLRQRYIDWGLPAEKITVLENGQRYPQAAPPAETLARPRRRFAFFGQLNPFKGIDVLLEAWALLPLRLRQLASLEIHGGANHLPDAFKARLDGLLDQAHRSVKAYGPYAGEDLPRLIAGVDWVVMPSIWWENSPMVIQEAFLHGRPMIVGDIGGMAEKVRDGVDGLHFRARNPAALAEVLARAIEDESLWPRLVAGIRKPPSLTEAAAQHVLLYEQLIDDRREPALAGSPGGLGSAA